VDRTLRRDEGKNGLDRRHDEARADSLPRNVRDNDSERAVGERKDVVEIARDEVRRHVARREAPRLSLELRRRKKAPLDRARELQLLLGELPLLQSLDALAEPLLQHAERGEQQAHDDRDAARDQSEIGNQLPNRSERHEGRRRGDDARQREADPASHEIRRREDEPRVAETAWLEPALAAAAEDRAGQVDEEA